MLLLMMFAALVAMICINVPIAVALALAGVLGLMVTEGTDSLVTIALDMSLPEQDYIEDCQVCCQPIRIRYTSETGELVSIEATRDT